MLQVDNRLPSNTPTINAGQVSFAEFLDNVLGLFRRNGMIIVCTTLIGIAVGAAYVVYAPRIYTANAQIIIDPRKLQIFQQRPLLGEYPLDMSYFENQMQILQSRPIALAVVKNLDLANDPTFFEQSKGSLSWFIDLLLGRSSSLAPSNALDLSELAANAIEQNLKIIRVGTSYVIDINFRSRNAERAVQIANAVAEAFLADQRESRYQSMQTAAAWLKDRLTELRDQQKNADRSVADFKTKHNIVTTNDQPVKQDALSLLNSQLITARTRTSELQAKLDRTEAIIRSNQATNAPGVVDQTVSDTLTNPVINKLRDKYLDYAARESEYSVKYGNNHSAVVNLRRQMQELRASMLDELRRIAETYKSDIEIAKRHQDSLEKAFEEAVNQANSITRAQGPLRELQGSADSYRASYEGLLQRYMQSVQEQSSPTTETRLLTSASLSTLKSGPKTILIAALTSLGGLLLGAGIGVLRQLTDRVFRTSDQVEATLHTECISVIPARNRARISKPSLGAVTGAVSIFVRRNIMWEIIEDPFSRYTEAIRAIKFAIDSNGDVLANKVIGITSSLPNEGKSTIAGSLALLAADTGAKTVLVDCDLRNPKLSRELAPDAKFGLLDIIAGEKSIEQAILKDASTGLAFLPTVFSSNDKFQVGRSRSNELLACNAIRKLFEQLREEYDYVVVDLSPTAPIIDVRSTTRFVDSYIFAVEWGSTRVNLVEYALKQANGIYSNLIGVVLNKTPMGSIANYQGHLGEYYNGKRFEQYR